MIPSTSIRIWSDLVAPCIEHATQRAIYQLVVEGDPVPKGRPRVEGGHARTPERTHAAEERIRWAFLQAYPQSEPDAVHRWGVRVRFYCQRKSHADIDNFTKTLLDALQGMAFANDSQVDELHVAMVRHSNHPRTAVELYVVEGR